MIHVIVTGGTIDSEYDIQQDILAPARHSYVMRYMKSLDMDQEIAFSCVCMKDARELQEQDLELLLECIENSEHKKIVVCHGYQTLVDSMRFLESNLKRKDQTIVFVGSRVPLSFALSDAGFHLGYACGQIESLNPGIYFCFKAQFFSLDVSKQLQQIGSLHSYFEQ